MQIVYNSIGIICVCLLIFNSVDARSLELRADDDSAELDERNLENALLEALSRSIQAERIEDDSSALSEELMEARTEGSGSSGGHGMHGHGSGSGGRPHGHGHGSGSGGRPHGHGHGSGSGGRPHGHGHGSGSGGRPHGHGHGSGSGSTEGTHGSGLGSGAQKRYEWDDAQNQFADLSDNED